MKIHLFNATALARELGRAEIGVERQAQYLLISFWMYSLFYYSGLAGMGAPVWSLPSIFEGIAIMAITIFGIAQAYEAAGGRGSRSFLIDFTCLSVPVSITTMIGGWGLYWGIRFSFFNLLTALSESHFQFARNLTMIGADFFGLLVFVTVVSIQAIVFWRIVRLLRVVREMQQTG